MKSAPHLVLLNLRRQLRRTILTTLTVALATLIYAVLSSVPASIDRIIDEAAKSSLLIITNRTGPYGLPARYCDEIRKIRHVEGCAAGLNGGVLYQNPRDYIGVVAADPVLFSMAADYNVSQAEVQGFINERRAALVGFNLLKKYRWHIGQEIIVGDLHKLRISLIVKGVVPSEHYPNTLIFRRDYLLDVLQAGGFPNLDRTKSTATVLIAKVDRPENLATAVRDIDGYFHNSDNETRSQTESNSIAGGLSQVGDVRAIIRSLCAVVILTVLLVSANSMAMTTRERITDVAVMRALGFGQGTVASLLFGEAGAIGLCGGVLGGTLAYGLFHAGINLGALAGGLGVIAVTADVAAEAIVVAVVVTLLSSGIPVLGATRIAPAVAFRQTI